MSDTPPDRKEAGDAPEGWRNAYVGFFAWAIITMVLYALSIGPVWWLGIKYGVSPDTMRVFYFPVRFLNAESQQIVDAYTLWWQPSSP